MARPSQHTDQRLLRAARELLPQTGFSGLTVRRVAERAGVNLGMFAYHFGNKRQFARRVLQDMYEEFFRDFSLQTATGTPGERLTRALLVLGRFVRDNRTLLVALLRDVLDREPEVIRFLEKNVRRHLRIILSIITAGQRTGEFNVMPLSVAVSQLAAGVAGPHIILAVLEQTRVSFSRNLLVAGWLKPMLADTTLEQRVVMAIAGLRAQPGTTARPSRAGTRRKS